MVCLLAGFNRVFDNGAVNVIPPQTLILFLDRLYMAPEKMEMTQGKLFWNDEQRLAMLALLLENVGMLQAVRLGDPALWKKAVAALNSTAD